MRFHVYAPPYRNSSAGTRVLHRLACILGRLGHRATVPIVKTNPDWATPVEDSSALHPETVVVYPEVVSGNPLNAARVVRYVLNEPGLLGGDTFYDASEFVVYYEERFRKAAERACMWPIGEERRLNISVIEPLLFYADSRVPKKRDALFVGKGDHALAASWVVGQGDAAHFGGLPLAEITATWPGSRWELADLLRSIRTLYTFDDCSAIVREAQICGAQVVLLEHVSGAGVADDAITWRNLRDDISTAATDYYRYDAVRRFVDLVKGHFEC